MAAPVDSPTLGRGARMATRLAVAKAVESGPGNYLGGHWVESLLKACPAPFRRRLALRLIALSPHYFYAASRPDEDERLRASRRVLADEVVGRFLESRGHVLDIGCGPGYLSAALAGRAHRVTGLDVSAGALACARVLNPAPNVAYITPDQLGATEPIDLAVSIAVAQHLSGEDLTGLVGDIAARLRPGGRLLMHFVRPDQHGGFRTEADWYGGRDVRSRLRVAVGLPCIGHEDATMQRIVEAAGFDEIGILPMACLTDVADDVGSEQLLSAIKAF
jgi:SAM-dependent methyltransferase